MAQPIEMPERLILKKENKRRYKYLLVVQWGPLGVASHQTACWTTTIIANLHHITTKAYLSIVGQALMTTWWLLPAIKALAKLRPCQSASLNMTSLTELKLHPVTRPRSHNKVYLVKWSVSVCNDHKSSNLYLHSTFHKGALTKTLTRAQ